MTFHEFWNSFFFNKAGFKIRVFMEWASLKKNLIKNLFVNDHLMITSTEKILIVSLQDITFIFALKVICECISLSLIVSLFKFQSRTRQSSPSLTKTVFNTYKWSVFSLGVSPDIKITGIWELNGIYTAIMGLYVLI